MVGSDGTGPAVHLVRGRGRGRVLGCYGVRVLRCYGVRVVGSDGTGPAVYLPRAGAHCVAHTRQLLLDRVRVRLRLRLRLRVRVRVRGRRGRQACPLKRTLSTTMTPPSASSPGTVRHAS